jgi:hypothetical protein
MRRDDLDTRELGGVDPLDAWLPQEREPSFWSRFQVRAALGLQPALAPALVFIPLGALLGPLGLNLLSAAVIAHLGPILSAALVVLGVFIGIAWGRRRPPLSVLGAATVEAGITTVIVAGSVWYLLRAWNVPLEASLVAAALTLGIVSSVSSAPADRGASDSLAAAIADLDDIVPVVFGAIVLAFAHPLGVERALMLGGWTVAFAVVIAIAANLLFARAEPAERGTFLVGALALLAGGSAFVAGSSLLAGFAAGLVWSRLSSAGPVLARYLGKLQHPLVVALLLVTGAMVSVSVVAIWLAVPMVFFRLTGKLSGSIVASRIAGSAGATSLASALIAPGILGVAFALQFAQVSIAAGATIISAAALATVFNELLALLMVPGVERR